MVFTHNKQPFDHDDSYQIAFEHLRQLDCGGQLASSAEFRCISGKKPMLGGWLGDDAESEVKSAVTSNDNAGIARRSTSSLSWVRSSNGDTAGLEHSKRPFTDDQPYQHACKRTRQGDESISPFSSTPEGSPSYVTADEEFVNRKEAAASKDPAKSSIGSSISSFPWFACSTDEEDTRLEPSVRLSFFPGYYEDHHWATGSNQLGECHSMGFDCSPRRPVALGPNHQVSVPAWRPKCFGNSDGESDCHDASTSSVQLIGEENSDKWTGSRVIPLSDSTSLASETKGGDFQIDCHCLDEGSIRCVRQHVIEAREKLRRSLGDDCFANLGFCEMGEDVALGWTEEEEQLFQEVVYSNPASVGKNFWIDLSRAFPSRSSKELVSYYFNVFMLRKRAEQNRCDPLNADSDNDEWQEDEGEFAVIEEDDEDSGVESPTEEDDVFSLENGRRGEVDIHEEGNEGDDCDDEGGFYGVSDGRTGDDKLRFGSNAQSMGKNSQDGAGEDQDVHDDSCTSYEGQHNGVDSGGRVDVLEETKNSLVEDEHENFHSAYRNDGVSAMTGHEYMAGHCDLKPWEIGFMRGLGKDVDFLPTCSVIEEVFGKESWESDTRDSHGVS